MPVTDAAAFKDPSDKRLEGFLRAIYSSAGSTLRPCLALAWVSRAIQAWSESLVKDIQGGVPRTDLLSSAQAIAEASSYLCDTSLDASQLTSRTSALSIAARRTLWLKNWSADISSKKSLTSLPYKGQRLFGEELEKIISQATGGKSTFLPQARSRASSANRRGKKIFVARVAGSRGGVVRHKDPTFAPKPTTRTAPRGRVIDLTTNHQLISPRRHDGAIPPESLEQIGGKLLRFREEWIRHSSDAWVKEIVSGGYHLDLAAQPPRRFIMSRVPSNPLKQGPFLECIDKMERSGVITPVPQPERFSGFYSNLFTVPKKDGTVRPVLDLKRLNKYIRSVRFKMETLRSVIRGMEQGQLMMSLDIRDAYLHVPIWPPHHRYLRFAFQNRHYQFVALPFGLSSAPRVFTKLMAVSAATLRLQGISVTPYLDDLLIKARSVEKARVDLQRAISLLQSFGWTINWSKSNMTPSHHMTFLGLEFNTLTQTVSLPLVKQNRIRGQVQSLIDSPVSTVHRAMQVLGSMVSAIEAVPFAQIHLRPLQSSILATWKGGSLNQPVRLSPATKEALRWWLSPENLAVGQSWATPDWRVMATDASLQGWGATWENHSAQGRWSPAESRLPINILELRAVKLALSQWSHLLRLQSVRIQSDNVTTVAYINRQGGTRSQKALAEAREILQWAEQNSVRLSAIHIPGVANTKADLLSRNQLDPGEWELHPEAFDQLVSIWGRPSIDLMASRRNRKVSTFFARYRDPLAAGVDAMTQHWQFKLAYVFPPLPMLPRVLKKLKQSRATVIVVAPFWPRRTWFSDLQELSVAPPVRLDGRPDLLQQGPIAHHNPGLFALTGWLLKHPSGEIRD
ncbi:uncharacterized protein LOC121403038 [Xenopus laevis]|uniref:ribonuclease H n=1 Tax=Xenopus laevis TaxID=8355 RepID=A0A8J1MZ44_XENLA|nr:uncharacterized protein LOC121403038 [Xenopus laevis]